MAVAVSALFLLFMGLISVMALTYFEREFKRSISSQQEALVTSIATSLDDKLLFSRKLIAGTARALERRDIGSSDRAQRFLDNQISARMTFDNGLFLFTGAGRIIAESPFIPGPGRRGKDISFREYFRETARTRTPYISAPYVSTHSPGHPAVMVTAPVLDGSGRLLAVLGGSIDLVGDNFIEDLRELHIGRSGYLFLVDGRRTIIMHPDPDRIMKVDVPPGVNRMFDRALAGVDGSGETVNSHGLRVIASFRHLRSTDWIVGANYPVAEAYAPVYQARRYFITAMMVGAVLAMVLVWLLMRRLTLPLAVFARHVDGMTAKTGDERLIALDSGDEIGVLARSFNTMLEELDRRQHAILESEVKYRGLFQSVPDAVLIGNLDTGAITEVNEAACVLYGYTREEFVRMHPADLCADREGAATAIERRERQLYGQIHLRSDGSQVPADVSLNYIVYGGHPCFIATVRDITSQVKAEEAIRTLNATLERRVSERTDELYASNRELEAFCYSVSHDLRAPLRSISGFSMMLAEDCGEALDDTGRGHLARIDAAAKRMGTLIDDLLSLSRVTRGDICFGPVDLSSMTDEILAELALHEQHRRVTKVVAPGCTAIGDCRLLWALLQNLLGNAWKFTSRTPQARIEFGVEKCDGEQVYYVRDNGAGFDMAYRSKLFKPFQRLHRQDEYPGSGVGLATVQRVVIRHGGRVWCESAPGYGAVFYFTLGTRELPEMEDRAEMDQPPDPPFDCPMPMNPKGVRPFPWA